MRPCGRCRNRGIECYYTEIRRESKESLRREVKELREQLLVRDHALQVLASCPNPQQIIKRLRDHEPIESICRHIRASQTETSADHDFPGSVSACSIEQRFAEHWELGNSPESVSSITGPPPLANPDASPDTVLSPNPIWTTAFTATSDDLERPLIIENTEQSKFGTSQNVASEPPLSRPLPPIVGSNWMPGTHYAPDASPACCFQQHLLSTYHSACMEQILKQQHQLLS